MAFFSRTRDGAGLKVRRRSGCRLAANQKSMREASNQSAARAQRSALRARQCPLRDARCSLMRLARALFRGMLHFQSHPAADEGAGRTTSGTHSTRGHAAMYCRNCDKRLQSVWAAFFSAACGRLAGSLCRQDGARSGTTGRARPVVADFHHAATLNAFTSPRTTHHRNSFWRDAKTSTRDARVTRKSPPREKTRDR